MDKKDESPLVQTNDVKANHANSRDTKTNEPKVNDTKSATKKRLVIGALTASVGVTLPSWEVMAHGNRSSHPTVSVANWAPDRYVLMREELTNPNAPETQRLRTLYAQLDQLSVEDDSRTNITQQIQSLEGRLKLTPVSRQVVRFIEDGDLDAAEASLSGVGSLEDQLDAYVWTLSDVALKDSQNQILTTSNNLPLVKPLSELALKKADEALNLAATNPNSPGQEVLLAKSAALLHNVANYCLPDIGETTPECLKLGSVAADKALKVRQELGRELDRSRAMIISGRYAAETGDERQAKRFFKDAKKLAKKSNSEGTIIFAEIIEARTIQKESIRQKSLVNLNQKIVAFEAKVKSVESNNKQKSLDKPPIDLSYEDFDYLKALLAQGS